MALPKNLHSTDFKPFDFTKKIKSAPERGAQFSVIYAQGGGWKSTISSYAKNPIILPVWLETGHRVADCPKFPEIGEYEGLSPINHVFSAINWLLKEDHSRKTLIIDNLGSFREAVVNDVQTDNPNEKTAFKLAVLYYGYYPYLLEAIATLMNKRGMDVILLAHSGSVTVNQADGTWYDTTSINAPQGKNTNARELIEARANNVFYIKNQPVTMDDKRGLGLDSKKKYITSSGKKVIYTRPREDFFAKCRLDMQDSYQIDKSDNIHELLTLKNNESIIDCWRDFYADPDYLPEVRKQQPRATAQQLEQE